MKGSSGAQLRFSGDFILKKCLDSREQCDWFSYAQEKPLVKGVRLPRVDYVDFQSYKIEFIPGTAATKFSSTRIIDSLVDQIMVWSKFPAERDLDWESYLKRLYDEHVIISDSDIISKIFKILEKVDPLPSSFSHGDLTLENVLVEASGNLVLIDPNFKHNLFQSYVLDLGKLMQSVHSDYHRVFDSHPGADPAPLCAHLKGRLGVTLWKASLTAEMSHIVRLRKYRPHDQRGDVDRILEKLSTDLGKV
jgi:hypothetical protein